MTRATVFVRISTETRSSVAVSSTDCTASTRPDGDTSFASTGTVVGSPGRRYAVSFTAMGGGASTGGSTTCTRSEPDAHRGIRAEVVEEDVLARLVRRERDRAAFEVRRDGCPVGTSSTPSSASGAPEGERSFSSGSMSVGLTLEHLGEVGGADWDSAMPAGLTSTVERARRGESARRRP